MTVKTWSIIDPVNDECNLVLTGSEDVAMLNTPDGFIYVEADYDKRLHDIINGEIVARDAPWCDPYQPPEDVTVRHKRDALLQSSDWTQVPDAPVDQAAWQVYRQALRDITEQEGFPLDITWPVPPS